MCSIWGSVSTPSGRFGNGLVPGGIGADAPQAGWPLSTGRAAASAPAATAPLRKVRRLSCTAPAYPTGRRPFIAVASFGHGDPGRKGDAVPRAALGAHAVVDAEPVGHRV